MAAPRQVLRRTQAERWSLGNSQRSARLGSARLGSARLGSARLGSARLGSARLGSARLGSARLGSARLGSARLGSARLGSARLGSARLGSARLGSARLGSARLGSARLGSALIMRDNGPGRFCQVFLRVIHNFSPSLPFRADDRAPPHTSRGKWSIRTNHRPHRKTSFGAPWARSIRRAQAPRFPLSMPLSVGFVKALPAVFSGALLAVFK